MKQRFWLCQDWIFDKTTKFEAYFERLENEKVVSECKWERKIDNSKVENINSWNK